MAPDKDKEYMKLALKLASKAWPHVSPDPLVGAVLVKAGKVIGTGLHKKFGEPHSEHYAVKAAGKSAKGSTLYITLEPCCHWGKNPPCTDLLIRSGIKRVVAAIKDPNPLVNGKGFRALKRAGIKVRTGVLEKEAARLNEFFIKHITTGLPFVMLKSASTLDGKIATRTGDSRWVSGKLSRRYVHELRSRVDAVMVGIGTVLKDDPLLTSRQKGKEPAVQPIRIVIDPLAKTPLNAKVIGNGAETIIAVTSKASPVKLRKLERKGAQIVIAPAKNGVINLKHLLKELGRCGICSVLIEGGGITAARALKQKIVDKVVYFIAPKLIGGRDAPSPVEGDGILSMKDALSLKDVGMKRMGNDIMVEGYIK